MLSGHRCPCQRRPGEAEVPHQMNLLGKVSVIGDDGPAFQGIHKLGRMKAQNFAGPESTDHFPLSRAAKSMRSIIHRLQFVRPSYSFDGVDVASTPPHMHTYDTSSSRRDEALNSNRIYVVGLRVDIRKDRCNLLPLQRVSCCDKRVRRQDHLVPESESADRNFQSDRSVAHRDAMLHT